MTDLFNSKFGTDKSVGAIASWCKKRKLFTGNDGRFREGCVTWQTGLHGEDFLSHYSNESRAKAFSGKNYRKYKIGDEIVRHGEPWICVSTDKGLPFSSRLLAKGRYVWQQVYGKIPNGHVVVHLDNDKFNCELENLACMPMLFSRIIYKNGWNNNPDTFRAGIEWCRLHYSLATKDLVTGRYVR